MRVPKILAGVLMVCSVAALAQTARTSSTPWVQFVASDKKGREYAAGLAAKDVSIMLDGAPATVADLRQASDLPLRVGIVVGLVEEQNWQGEFRHDIAKLVRQLPLRPETDRAFIINITTDTLMADWTADKEALAKFAESLPWRPYYGFYSGMEYAINKLNAERGAMRKAVVLFSGRMFDGFRPSGTIPEDQKEPTVRGMGRALQRSGVAFYGVAWSRPVPISVQPQQSMPTGGGGGGLQRTEVSQGDLRATVPKAGQEMMERLSEASGGRTFQKLTESMSQVAGQIEKDLANTWLVSFEPGAAPRSDEQKLQVMLGGAAASMKVRAPKALVAAE